ncbi:TTPAL-like protein [Mya arenaria]|uniref:TTPAL-like protein n=1 Tax=Mya arenaria TaxID=6604 RepID=A0ABY7DT42_MYAAR|nr:alpha-tocopherol transfer protein-like [Mya arenaria]XP_052792618.1 alpha-tocopherol transfer protein-like [Mya arenaria]WAR00017.1 TTPAL-like protein [Mya arenaria]
MSPNDPDAKYVCSFTDAEVNKAIVELKEHPADRLPAVRAFRKWIEEQSSWLTSPTDTKFLLAFLRISKFSQLTARERLSNFLASFNDSVSYLNGHDPADPKYLNILRASRVFTPLPQTDKEGRTIILGNYDNFDPTGNSYEYADFQRSILGVCHSLVFCDEHFQLNGVNFLMDYGAVTMKHITFGGSENMKKRAQHFQKALPVSIRQFHHYNNGPIFNVLLHILRPALPEKMRIRVFMHGHSMVSVYKEIPMELLPEEYLADDYQGDSAGSLQDITENNIKKLLLDPERRKFIKDLWSGRYGADLSRKPQLQDTTDGDLYGSFRKLNI